MADAIERMSALLRQLPAVGEKTAQRLIFYILAASPEYGRALALALGDLIERVRPCQVCGNLSEQSPCRICSDPERDGGQICVVEKVQDLLAIENSRAYHGFYHVLHGVLSPLDGKGPEQIGIESLLARLPGKVKELIIATGSSVEGEATALYLKRRIVPLGLRISRIASGIPVGGELEYVGSGTLGRALAGRREM
ncbi:MAG TPA: recombination mediator RecR [Myxococcota bacterium]|nr:recombination mediator RecR [Myxococcota bacterium]